MPELVNFLRNCNKLHTISILIYPTKYNIDDDWMGDYVNIIENKIYLRKSGCTHCTPAHDNSVWKGDRR